MNSNELMQTAVDALAELKGVNVQALDVRRMTNITDFMVVASGGSARQVVALAENVVKRAKENGVPPIGTEGMSQGEWALVDLGDVVVHVMLPETRDFYQLEKLWDARATGLSKTRAKT